LIQFFEKTLEELHHFREILKSIKSHILWKIPKNYLKAYSSKFELFREFGLSSV